MNIQRSKNIVKKDDLSLRIDRPGESDPSFLTSTQSQTLFSDFSLVASLKQNQVRFQGALVEDLPVTCFIKFRIEDDVILE
jgi:hypothetical protein